MSQPVLKASISKILSANDIGKTGGHQAGILIPKREEILNFFPKLDPAIKNPRISLVFKSEQNGIWEFSYIYYNNKYFGGTRNEYRLTRMTGYLYENRLKEGDEIILEHLSNDSMKIRYSRKNIQISNKLRLSTHWKIIKF
jgi:hypothetical protein